MRTIRAGAGLLALSAMLATSVGVAPRVAADPVGSGTASAFGASANIAGTALIPPTPEATVTAPPFAEDDESTTLPLDVDPVAINGTLTAIADVHQASDLPSLIDQEDAQHELEGPYNARAVGQIEGLQVLLDAVPDGPLLDADLIRAEAVAVCTAGTVQYSATSEVVDLVIGGQDPLSGPLNDLLSQITEALEPLADVVDVDINVITETADGIAVDALVITVLGLLGDDPLVEIRLGHAEVSGVACGDAESIPECSDGIDNDGDGLVDIEDPECHTDGDPDNPDSYDPDHDDEGEGPGGEGPDTPGCSDGIDNDGDGMVDAADPDCHTDGDPNNPDSLDPDRDEVGGGCGDGLDNDGDGLIDAADPDCHTDGDPNNPDSYDPGLTERNGPAGPSPRPGDGGDSLPNTGADVAAGLAALAAVGGLGLLALRRRSLAS